MMVHVEPASGRVMLLPRPKTGGGGGGGGTSGGNQPPVTIVAADPATANEGDLIYNTIDSALKVYQGGSWHTIDTDIDIAALWGNIGGTLANQTDLQTALNAKQPLDADLTSIAALTATTDNFLIAVASAWASRTPAQAKTTLALVKGDVGLGNVDNTSDASKPVSTAQQTALDLKAASVHTHAAGDTTSGSFDIARIPTGSSGTTVSLGNHSHGASGPSTGLVYATHINLLAP